ncbi:MAG: peptidoglycan-associated lipoprotein Pal [Paracoccaceae bacterium]|nr:peptidoglycan-associated lipoprotein Pal [Paracoccaceae bacterium]MDE3237854.1 peptidoglycan-associated lipoprotein Pal [Paracoccaceae bacterium]
MRNLNKALLVVAALGLAACNNPNRYGGGAGMGGDAAGLNGAGGISGQGLGDASNPASIAYFNQRVGDRVYFKLDQSNLSPEAQQTLTKQAQWLNQYPSYAIIIEGHTDERGTREYNIALGARRAQVVKDFLSTHGVNAGRIRTISYGKERPVATCPNESCYSQNRRAVTVLSRGKNS